MCAEVKKLPAEPGVHCVSATSLKTNTISCFATGTTLPLASVRLCEYILGIPSMARFAASYMGSKESTASRAPPKA